MAKRVTIAGLQRVINDRDMTISRLEGERENICSALGIYYREEIKVVLEKIVELNESAGRNKVNRAYSDGVNETAIRSEEKHYIEENHRLWFLLRSLIGDKTLDKELEALGRDVVSSNYQAKDHMGVEPPFKKPRF